MKKIKKLFIVSILFLLFTSVKSEAQFGGFGVVATTASNLINIIGKTASTAQTVEKVDRLYELLSDLYCASYNWDLYTVAFDLNASNCIFDYETKLISVTLIEIEGLLNTMMSGDVQSLLSGTSANTINDKLDNAILKLESLKDIIRAIGGRYENEMRAQLVKVRVVEGMVAGQYIDF